MVTVKIKKLRENALIPCEATKDSAGYDLYSCLDENEIINPGETKLIPTGISIQLPNNKLAAFIYARSGLALKNGIIPANCVGVIDYDYRGEIYVALKNTSDSPFIVENNFRIAQMVISTIIKANFEITDNLSKTKRGSNGFGSTGIK